MRSAPPARPARPAPPLTALHELETRVGRAIPVHPHVISALKVLVVTPAFALVLPPIGAVDFNAGLGVSASGLIPFGLFIAFLVLDVLDGVVARARGLESRVGRVLDRVTDVPLLGIVAFAAWRAEIAAAELLLAKVALDVLVGVLSLAKGRAVDDRVRVSVSDLTALALVMKLTAPNATDGVTHVHPFLNADVLNAMLGVNIVFSAVVGLYNAGVLQKRFIADALSASNALCGIASIYFATQKEPAACLLLLLVGAGFDGLDGAAARRWGGTKFGVYSDDIADAINYAIAPGVALAFTLEGVQGTVVGVAFSLLTISRLVFFTLNKSNSDPNYFSGVPSTIGGIVALCALILFGRSDPVIVGLLVGVAVVLMVSFDSAYRHLGRLLFAAPRARVLLAFIAGATLLVGGVLTSANFSVGVVLALSLVYGFLPQIARFRALLTKPAPAPSSSSSSSSSSKGSS